MSRVDLHIHSNASDGCYSPEDIVKKAAGLGLEVIALADHDTINGIPEALETAATYPNLKVIPAVEISTDVPHGEIHMLGYFIDYANPEFSAQLAKMRDSRIGRAKKMVNKLNALGIKIEWSRVQELAAGSSVGRPHIAQAMLEKNYIATFKEAFDKYIGRNGPAYAERDKMTPAEAVQLILKVDGLPVFAHPLTFNDYEKMTVELTKIGLVGIEAYYKNATPDEIKRMLTLADRFNLIPTGGTDYHGIEADEVMMGGVEVPMTSAERLIELAKQRLSNGVN